MCPGLSMPLCWLAFHPTIHLLPHQPPRLLPLWQFAAARGDRHGLAKGKPKEQHQPKQLMAPVSGDVARRRPGGSGITRSEQ